MVERRGGEVLIKKLHGDHCIVQRRGPVHVNRSWQKIATTREVETFFSQVKPNENTDFWKKNATMRAGSQLHTR